MSTPKEVIKDLDQLLFKFLWHEVDKVTRLPVINVYEKSGLIMIDVKRMIPATSLDVTNLWHK